MTLHQNQRRRISTLLPPAALLLATCSISSGQTSIAISSNSAAPGSTVSLEISLQTTSAGKITGLQWTLSFSTDDFTAVSVAPGPAAEAAGKSVKCSRALGSNVCLVSGPNRNTLADGVVAKATLTVSGTTSTTSSPVALTGAIGADGDGGRIAVSATNGTVRIVQPKPAPNGVPH